MPIRIIAMTARPTSTTRLKPPKTIVVRFGRMKLVGEFPYDGDAKPGCGSKLVARTHRGTELVEMLTTTCENAGVRQVRHPAGDARLHRASGGRDFPFYDRRARSCASPPSRT
jgi:hypothetical protein